jgi:branched-chain amino acid transport system ATP-binding protein
MIATAQPLSLNGLAAGYNSVPVVHDIDLHVDSGEIVAILGRNGAGKSTILSTIAGLIPLLGGTISLDNKPASGGLHHRVRRGMGLVTETRAIVRKLSVLENLRLGLGTPEEAFELFPELRPLASRKAGLLSGGEQQMVVLGRVLASRPRLLLVDELSFGLAPLVVERLLESLRLAAHSGTGVLLVEQHPVAALSVADRAYVLAHGVIQVKGTGADLLGRLSEIEETYMSARSRNTRETQRNSAVMDPAEGEPK